MDRTIIIYSSSFDGARREYLEPVSRWAKQR